VRRAAVLACILVTFTGKTLGAEDGYNLWLRYARVTDSTRLAEYQAAISQLLIEHESPTLRAAREELARGLRSLIGREIPVVRRLTRDGTLVIGTAATSRLVGSAPVLLAELARVGPEGFVIRAMTLREGEGEGEGGKRVIVIAANRDIGALYGAFALLRQL